MKQGTNIKTIDYVAGFQYQNQKPLFFPHPEGYVNITADQTLKEYWYVYNHTDHLGNIRVSYAIDPENTTQLKILEENNYYPFGLKHQQYNEPKYKIEKCDDCHKNLKFSQIIHIGGIPETLAGVQQSLYNYKYNGKEYQDELGLNMYAMDMRQYDPAIARWVVQDPIVHHSMSPYSAFDNNPVFFADPSGADSIYNWETGQYVINGQVVSQDEAIAYANAGGNADGSNNNTVNDWEPDGEGNLIAGKNDNAQTLADYLGVSYNEALDILVKVNGYKVNDKGILNLKERDKIKVNNELMAKVNNASTAMGLVYYAGEKLWFNNGKWLSTETLKYYNTNFYGNQYTGKQSAALFRSGIFKWGGMGLGILGLGVSFHRLNQANTSMEKTEAKVDIAIGSLMTFGGPFGFAIGGTFLSAKTMHYLNGPIQPSDGGVNWENKCFVGDTKIMMSNGVEKYIKDIKVGDKVKTYNIETKSIENKKVQKIYQGNSNSLVQITFNNGIININTDIHPYYVLNKGWASINTDKANEIHDFTIENLEERDIVYLLKENKLIEVTVKKIEVISDKRVVYNLLEIEDNHSFFANGILVHNKYNK